MSFAGNIQQLASNLSMWWLQRPNIARFVEAFGFAHDLDVETLSQGLQFSQPLRCDVSALPALSRDRGIRLYATEPIASRRYRLSRWRQLRRQFGTHQGAMRNIQPFFLSSPSGALPTIRTVHQSGDPGTGALVTWHTLTGAGDYSVVRASPANWDWDGQTSQWSRYWVIVYTDALGLPAQPTWDGGQTWDGGSVWDGLYTAAQIADMVAGLKEAKSAHSRLQGLIFATDPASFDPGAVINIDPAGWSTLPDGKWAFTIDNNTGKPTRLPGASFVYDLSAGPGGSYGIVWIHC